MSLSPVQQAAATRSGQDVCVVAGPGSGKTRVLVERFAWLVEERGVQPASILAFTFTEKAANEIRARLLKRFEGRLAIQEQVERAWVSTIHGFCKRLLSEYSLEVGVAPGFAVLDELQARSLLAEAIEAVLDRLYRDNRAALRTLASSVGAQDLIGALGDLYNAMRIGVEQAVEVAPACDFNAFLDDVQRILEDPLEGWTASQRDQIAAFRQWATPLLALRGKPIGMEHLTHLTEPKQVNLGRVKRNHEVTAALREIKQDKWKTLRAEAAYHHFLPRRRELRALMAQCEQEYESRKRNLAALDFSDLEHFAVRLLTRRGDVREAVQQRFDAILMDEMQDTNPLQWSLVRLLRRLDCFFAVGDVNQSIYRFRHAEPRVFAGYAQLLADTGNVIDRLHENYRSRAEILQASECVAGSLAGVQDLEFTACRVFAPREVPSVEAIVVSGSPGDDLLRREASWVARRIRELVGVMPVEERDGGTHPLAFSEIAILIRKGGPMERFEAVLAEFGVPCVIGRGSGFFDAPEVTDLVNLLRVIDNPRDELSMAAVLRSPLVGLDDDALLALRAKKNLADDAPVAGLLARLRPLAGHISPDRLLARAIDQTNYLEGLEPRARANVDKLLAYLRTRWSDDPKPLRALLNDLARAREERMESEAPPADASNAVRMMSIHAAKGLEFPVVFFAQLHAGVNRRQDDLCYSNEAGLGVRWRMPDGMETVADAIHEKISAAANEAEAQEAARLLFVAMTRAEQHLVFSFARQSRGQGAWPKQVAAAFGFGIDETDAAPVVIRPEGREFDVRLFRTNQDAANTFGASVAVAAPELRVIAPLALDAQADATSSVTALVRFAECPRRWLLGTSLGFRAAPPVTLDSDDGTPAGPDFGTAVHAFLAGDEEVSDEAVRELAAHFQRSDLGARAEAAVRSGRETPFLFAMDGLVLRGQIDLWFEEADGGLVIVDYKTDRFTAESRAERLPLYALQLRFYAAALSRQLHKPVKEAWLFLLREDHAEPVPLNGEDDLHAAIAEFRLAQQRLAFPPMPGARCHHCEFRPPMCDGVTACRSS